MGFQCLGHSNWTICSLLSPFCSENFPTFHSYAPEPISFIPQENEKMEFSQPKWGTGVWVPGAFKLDHLQPVEPIFFWKFWKVRWHPMHTYTRAPRDFSSERDKRWFAVRLTVEGHFRIVRGRKVDSSSYKNVWDTGVYVRLAFKLDHLQPIKTDLTQKFSNFLPIFP